MEQKTVIAGAKFWVLVGVPWLIGFAAMIVGAIRLIEAL